MQKSLHGLLAASLALSPVFSPLGARSAAAAISNTAEVTATTPDGGSITSAPATETVITIPAAPLMTVTKTGALNDDDGTPGVSAGDTITYTVTISNTGTGVLSGVTPADPIAPLTLESGDTNANGFLNAGETWVYTGSYALTQADIDSDGGGDGNIENTVTVSSNELPDQTASAEVPMNIAPGMEVAKTGTLVDNDGTPGLSAGDAVDYTITIRNTGNIRLTNVSPADPLVTLALQSGDTNGDNRLDVDEVWTYGASYAITLEDLDTLGGGDGDLDNTVTVTSDQLPDQSASHELPLAPVASLEVKKTATAAVQLFPTVHALEYQIQVRNNGAVTHTGIRLSDDVAASLAPATITGIPTLTVSGFGGAGGANPGFDGSGDTDLLAGDVQLAPGGIALITIGARFDTGGASLDGVNTAYASSDQLSAPIASDDPTQTPSNPNDTNPTPVGVTDTDGDGSPDTRESLTNDRDGDGVPDAEDYDPTGYFYCQADGRILAGGRITVENLTSGGSLSAVGTGSGITILRDGSDGQYQFHANEPGTFRLTYTLPAGGIASTSLLSSGTIDVSSLLPDNPAVLGSGEFGSSRLLADPAPAENPFYTVFEIEPGDPAIFNNNIPLQYCGTPSLAVSKTVAGGPDLQPDGSYDLQYRLTIASDGDEPVDDVQLVDDLAAVFGGSGFTVNSLSLEAGPAGFSVDPFHDGSANTALLTAGNTLQPGETAALLLDVNIRTAGGTFDNTVIANGVSPLDGSALPPVTDTAAITIVPPDTPLTVEKTALPGRAPLGAPVAYTITARNGGAADLAGVEIVDELPAGMSYAAGSARLDGIAAEPAQDSSGRRLTWDGVDIPAGGAVTITLTAAINASASGDEFINRAYMRDPVSGRIVSNIATARVLLEIEPVFQCSDVIGRVFDDRDRDGYHDDGEPGLPGVRLATPGGLLVVTDEFGRYSIACGAIPDARIGSNFLLKLDPATLPTGYAVTTENPRVVRLTQGKMARLNFGAAGLRLVRLELTDAAFETGDTRPSPETLAELGAMLRILDEEPARLSIIYSGAGEDRELARQRLTGIEALLREAWDQRQRSSRLIIETRLTE